ncbi:DNA glycosylase AlkZ-like family protein [Enterobacter hormaechei]
MSLLKSTPVNIVARSPYLVLFSRLGNYPPQWLDNALSQGELMEYWAHEACFSAQRFCTGASPHARPDKIGWNAARSGWWNTRMKSNN